MTTETPCLLCPAVASEAHHLTGKPPAYLFGKDRPHIDPDLTVLVCKPCHKLLHEDLRSQGVDISADGLTWTVLDRNEFRLARLACFLGRISEVGATPWVAALAVVLRTAADDLDDLRPFLPQPMPDRAHHIKEKSQ
jgi:hypothetical protein